MNNKRINTHKKYSKIGPFKNNKFKQKMCKKWVKHGECPYNEKCQYAHGKKEIRKPLDPTSEPFYPGNLKKNYYVKELETNSLAYCPKKLKKQYSKLYMTHNPFVVTVHNQNFTISPIW